MATPEATRNYFKRLAHKEIPVHSIRDFGKTGWQVSSIGFGGYRIRHDSAEHARALRYALLNGFNLIDTSSNYGDGGSEMLIGNLLHEMFERDEVHRDEIVLVSKVGYIQGQNLRLVQDAEARGQPFPEVVEYADGCWHCIHPEFLEDQLSRSLERLNLPSLDVYLLHNPEYFLADAQKRGELDLAAARERYFMRIGEAFRWMEEKVAEGKIKAYGISSNTFPAAADDFEFTSLEEALRAAETIAEDHHFQVIQFPFNLFEPAACTRKNQANGGKTLLELARERNLATLANRPLNAMVNGGMVRLASFARSDPQDIRQEFDKYLAILSDLESRFTADLLPGLPDDLSKDALMQVFSLSQQLSNALEMFPSWEHWDHVRQNYLMPQSYATLSYLDQKLAENPAWASWSRAYAEALLVFLENITRKYENDAQKRSVQIERQLDSLDASLRDSETLSQKALQVLTSVP
ncbi:MAG: aldo/keto reductase, partial [Calditrichaeota bacterium]